MGKGKSGNDVPRAFNPYTGTDITPYYDQYSQYEKTPSAKRPQGVVFAIGSSPPLRNRDNGLYIISVTGSTDGSAYVGALKKGAKFGDLNKYSVQLEMEKYENKIITDGGKPRPATREEKLFLIARQRKWDAVILENGSILVVNDAKLDLYDTTRNLRNNSR